MAATAPPGPFFTAVKALTVARTVLGATLLWGSAAAAGYAVSWTIRSHEASNRVLAAGGARLASEKAFDAATSCSSGTPAAGQLAGLIEIPQLSLKAPVEQGESQTVLSAAVGHDLSSVWPGSDGTAVLAAHDVSWFARIGTLQPGQTIEYVSSCRTVTFKVTGHKIVPSGSPVSNSASPTLVLDTCWPNDALWWTPDRELVIAKEVSSRPTGTSTEAKAASLQSHAAPSAPIAVPAPPALVAQGLTLDTNPTLLGTMRVTGSPSPALVQSPQPLAVAQAALTSYFATLHAVASDNPGWFAAVAPGVKFPAYLAGATIAEYLTRLTEDVKAAGSAATGAVLSAEVQLNSGSDVDLVVSSVVRHGELLVTGWHAG